MPIPIACPNCKNPINAPESAAGKTITCWKCSTAMSVPIPDADVVDDELPKRTKSRPRVDRDDDDDDRPVRKKAAAKKKGPPIVLIASIGGGVLLLLIAAVAGYLIFGGKKAGIAGGLFAGKAPPGYSSVGEVGVRCRAFVPGNAKGNYGRKTQDPNSPVNPDIYLAMALDESAFVAKRSPGFTHGTSEDQLMKNYETLKSFRPAIHMSQKLDITNKKMITVSGQPALQFTVVEKPFLFDSPPNEPDFFRDRNNKEKDRIAKEGRQIVVILFVNGEWSYAISIVRKMQEPDPETIKTVIESITFL